MDPKDTAYLAWLDPQFSDIDKIPAQERRKRLLLEVLCGIGMGALLCLLTLGVGWLYNTGVASR